MLSQTWFSFFIVTQTKMIWKIYLGIFSFTHWESMRSSVVSTHELYFKISAVVFFRRKNVLWVAYDMSKWWQHFHICMNCPFKMGSNWAIGPLWDSLSYLEYLQNNQMASFINMALSHSDTPITDYSSAINARLFLCTTRGIYNSQFGLIIQSFTCVYDGPLMEGGGGGLYWGWT